MYKNFNFFQLGLYCKKSTHYILKNFSPVAAIPLAFIIKLVQQVIST